MNQDILLSKIVANPTDTTWSQAYTTLNVYVTLSIENENSKTPVTSYGKELLEKLQREFFALDQKTLDNIKKAVSNVSEAIEEGYKYSILVGTITDGILYIVIASTGQVVIRRGDKMGVIATGVENELHGFSGKLLHDDIVIFESGEFANSISQDTLSGQLESQDVSQIAESITPLIHEHSKGTESAIILQYKDLKTKEVTPEQQEVAAESAEEEVEESSATPQSTYDEENLWTKTPENNAIEELEDDSPQEDLPEEKKASRPFIPIPSVNFVNRKIIIIAAVIVLVAILGGGIFMQFQNQNQQKAQAEFNTVYQPIQSKFDEANNLASLNESLALAEFNDTLAAIDEAMKKFPEGSTEYNKLNELKSQVQSKISELGGGGSAQNVKELVKAGGDIKSITAISARGGRIVILDTEGKQVATINSSGKVQKTYDIEDSAKSMTSDDQYVYTLGDVITRIDLGNGETEEIVDDPEGGSIQSFGSNVYTLTSNDILKYRAPSYESASYFTDSPNFKSTPQDISISGPIWVLESAGLERFTKGINDDIEIQDLKGPIGEGGKIYADSELDNVYILDVKNQRVVVLDSDAKFQKQYEGTFIKNATSIAIDEENSVGYVVSNNTVHAFDL